MSHLELRTDPRVKLVFDNYPPKVRQKLENLRTLIIEAAEKTDGLGSLEETLKWGEPSFLTKHGSTLRMDWKKETPDQYQLYFKCTSRLIETFRIVFGDLFEYENNRAIIFQLNQEISEIEVKKCITATLTYHKVKNELTLGL